MIEKIYWFILPKIDSIFRKKFPPKGDIDAPELSTLE
jgi:hypothetical protein